MSTKVQSIPKNRTEIPTAALLAAVILAIIGVAAWIYQLVAGMQITELGQQVVWGLYIAAFFAAVGAGAALLFLRGLHEFTPLLADESLNKSLMLSLAAFITGGLLITLDLGNPLAVWRMLTSFETSSLMIWDFYLLIVAVIVSIVFWMATRKGQKNQLLGLLAMLAAVIVVVVEAWMLASMAARPFFAGGIMTVNFLVGAAVMGLSLALIAGIEKEKAARWLGFALLAALVLALAEGLTGLLSVEERAAVEARALLTGWAAPLFWFQIVAGIMAPLVILRSKSLLWLAGLLAVFGVLAEKSWILAIGQSLPWMPQEAGAYLPNLLEIVAVVGIAGIGMLVYLLLKKFAQ